MITMSASGNWDGIKALFEKVSKGEADPREKENDSLLDFGIELGILRKEDVDFARHNYHFALIDSVAGSVSSDIPAAGQCDSRIEAALSLGNMAAIDGALSEAFGTDRWRKKVLAIFGAIAVGKLHPDDKGAKKAIQAGLQMQLVTLKEWDDATWDYYKNERVQRSLLDSVAEGAENPERMAVKAAIDDGIQKGYYTAKQVKAATREYQRFEAMTILDSIGNGMYNPNGYVLAQLEGYVKKKLITRDEVRLALEGFSREKERIGDVIRQISTGRLDPDKPDVWHRITAALDAKVITPDIVRAALDSNARASVAATLRESARLGFVVTRRDGSQAKNALKN
jgi:hypothetical protein